MREPIRVVVLSFLCAVLTLTTAPLLAQSSLQLDPPQPERSGKALTPDGPSTVVEVDPPFGSPDEASTVTISGENFLPGSRVRLTNGGPHLIGRYQVEGNTDAYKIALDGDIAALAYFDNLDKLGGLHLVDISDPTNPQRVGNFVTVDVGVDVVCGQDFAYTLTLNPYTFVPGIRVVDIDDPEDPQEVGKWFTTGFPRGLTVANQTAFVSKTWGGLSLVDVTDPANPVEASLVESPAGEISDVALVGNIALVAAGSDGLLVLDVTDISSPIQVNQLAAMGGFTLGVVVRDETAYVVDPTVGLQVLDVTDATNPVLMDTIPTPGSPSDVFLQGNLLYLADGPGGLSIFDVSDPLFPQRIGGFGQPGNEGFAGAVIVRDGIAYITNFFVGMTIVDVSQPAAPALLGSFPTPASAEGIEESDSTAIVAMSSAGLYTYDISDPLMPLVMGTVPTAAPSKDVTLSGNHAYVSIGTGGVEIFDVSNLSAPVSVGRLNTRGSTQGIAVRDNIAYVADGRRGLLTLDVSDPTAPVQLDDYNSPGDSADVTLVGSLAYLADGNRGLQIVDIQDPNNLTRIGGFDTAGRSLDVIVMGSLAYVADDFGGLRILDVTDPTAPVLLRTVVTPGSAAELILDSDRLLVADKSGGVTVIDISDPLRAFISAQYDTPGSALGLIQVGPQGGDVLVSDGTGGLQLVHLNPAITDVTVQSGSTITATIPAGLTAGPYDVAVVVDGEVGTAKRNGFVVCDAKALEARLTPIFDPNSMTVRTPLSWNLDVTSDPVEADATLMLPALVSESANTIIRKIVDPTMSASEGRIEIASYGGASGTDLTAVITLTAADPDTLDATWADAVANGGFDIPQIDPTTYGSIALVTGEQAFLRTSVTIEDGTRASIPVSHRYEFEDGVIVYAGAWGSGFDHQFEVVAEQDGGCPSSSELQFFSEVNDRCFELLAENPQLVALCGAGQTVLPSFNDGDSGRILRPGQRILRRR